MYNMHGRPINGQCWGSLQRLLHSMYPHQLSGTPHLHMYQHRYCAKQHIITTAECTTSSILPTSSTLSSSRMSSSSSKDDVIPKSSNASRAHNLGKSITPHDTSRHPTNGSTSRTSYVRTAPQQHRRMPKSQRQRTTGACDAIEQCSSIKDVTELLHKHSDLSPADTVRLVAKLANISNRMTPSFADDQMLQQLIPQVKCECALHAAQVAHVAASMLPGGVSRDCAFGLRFV